MIQKQDASLTSHLSDGAISDVRSCIKHSKHERTWLPSQKTLTNCRDHINEGAIKYCGPTLSQTGNMMQLDLNTVLTTLIRSADMWERGRTSEQIENGNFPIDIKVCTSVDGGAWIAHRGFILLVLCISDYEMLLKLGKLIVFIILVLYWYLFKHNI